MDVEINNEKIEVVVEAEVGDIIRVIKEERETHFFIVSKLKPNGGGTYESTSTVTVVNLEMNTVVYHEYNSVKALVAKYIRDYDSVKIIKSSKFKLQVV